jgi:2-oxoglutarate dehydrogenase complex dehydrogenase (E1) component-like enzyme
MTASTPRDLAEGRWLKVIDDPGVDAQSRNDITRLVLCSGKIAIDLLTGREQRSKAPARQSGERSERSATAGVAVCRVEQIFPVPVREILEVIERYPKLDEIFWVQEEPENMGVWDFVRPTLEGLAGTRRFAVLARPRSSSPAEGSSARHSQNQERLIEQALNVKLRSIRAH